MFPYRLKKHHQGKRRIQNKKRRKPKTRDNLFLPNCKKCMQPSMKDPYFTKKIVPQEKGGKNRGERKVSPKYHHDVQQE